MALHLRLSGYVLRCDKCGRTIRDCVTLLTKQGAERLTRKFSVCPVCMESRRNRDKTCQ
jgi:hypothetical protein